NAGQLIDEAGWMPQLSGPVSPELRGKAIERNRAHFSYYFGRFPIGGPGCAALRESLALCRAERVPVALVLMPEGPAFRGFYPPGARVQLNAFLAELHRDYGAAV